MSKYKKLTFEGIDYWLVPVVEEIPNEKIKIAFVVGHNEINQGDWSYAWKTSEWQKWKAFLTENFSEYSIFLHDPTINSYTERQRVMAEKTRDYDLVFELHHNAFDPDYNSIDNACGAEALVMKNNSLMAEVASRFINLMYESMRIKQRYVIMADSGTKGYGFLRETKGDAIILEPVFGDHPDDISKFSQVKYAQVIRDTIKYYKKLKNNN